MLTQVLLPAFLFLISSTLASPLAPRATNEVVQGTLGTDEYWNAYDGGLNNYTLYLGNGDATSWPSRVQWLSFNDMWTINQHVISRSCAAIYNTSNLSPAETTDLYDAIQTVAHATRVDHRFILAVIMQETKGCVRASTSISPDGTVRNPGLMQDHDGSFSCNSDDGKISIPCPQAQIVGMIMDGVAGTAKGDGLAGALSQQSAEEVEFAQAYYRAARLYNSGMIDDSGDLEKGTATHCYASDIANRMVGWVDAKSTCTLDD